MLQESIKKLVQYGINTGLTPECRAHLHDQPAFGCHEGG